MVNCILFESKMQNFNLSDYLDKLDQLTIDGNCQILHIYRDEARYNDFLNTDWDWYRDEYYYLAIVKDGELHTVWLNSKGECEDSNYQGCYNIKLKHD